MAPATYTAAEVAERLDLHVETFYRRYAELVAGGMPASITPRGRYKFDRISIEAWIGRFHPFAPPSPAANDSAPPGAIDDLDLESQREYLRQAYAR